MAKAENKATSEPAEPKAETKQNSGLEKRVTRLEAVVRILEKQMGIDLNRDGAIGGFVRNGLAIAVGLMVMVTFVSSLCYGVLAKKGAGENPDRIYVETMAVEYNGDIITEGSITSAGMSVNAQASVAVIEGSTNTIAAGLNVFTSSGSATAITNTIVLARPTGTGVTVAYIQNSIDATNLLAIAASGSWNSSAVELDAGEQAILYSNPNGDGPTTNAWLGAEL